MKKILAFIFHPIWLVLIGLVIVALLIWWFGPLIKIGDKTPLYSSQGRWLAIAGVTGLVFLRYLWRQFRYRATNQRLLEELRGSRRKKDDAPQKAAPSAGEMEVETLGKRFDAAIAQLRQSGVAQGGTKPGITSWLSMSNQKYLYQLPWYMFIGAPGSGKTTALIHSGLQFPLAESLGAEAVKGVGGTRNCDWWFTDEAVLIDTAGRYTTQESDKNIDQTAWQGFLSLLKKNRPRQPINGVLLTISVADLVSQGPTQQEEHAAALRARLRELNQNLGIRFPVYVLVTKSDLLAGFMDHFADLGRHERAQVWGTTLPTDFPPNERLSRISGELATLAERVAARVPSRMQAEHDIAARAGSLSFPQQFAAFSQTLAAFLDKVFPASKLEEPAMLRGVYFTSGTQEGAPIDRLMGTLARSMGMERQVLPPQQSSGRSFFITRLLKEVVFGEQGLAGANMQFLRRRHLGKLATFAGIGLLSVGLVLAWWMSYSRNKNYVDEVDAKAIVLNEGIEKSGGKIATANLLQLSQLLDMVRSEASTEKVQVASPPMGMRFGLWQGGTLDSAAQIAYRKLLEGLLLPNIAQRLEHLARNAPASDTEYSYEALKAYLMLHHAEWQDKDDLKAWITYDWFLSPNRLLPEASAQQQEALTRHLDALLAQGALRPTRPEDKDLIADLRIRLDALTLPQRVYNRIKRKGNDKFPEFTLARAVGPSANTTFVRASGKPLTQGVSGFFTYDAYHKGFLDQIERVAKQLAVEETWVRGVEQGSFATASDGTQLQRLGEDVRRLYLEDYARQWGDFIGDVRLIRIDSLDRATKVIAPLAKDSTSPLETYLRAVAKETALGVAPSSVASTAEKAKQGIDKVGSDLTSLFGGGQSGQATSQGKPEDIVDQRFAALHVLAGNGTPEQPGALEDLRNRLKEIYFYLASVQNALATKSPPPAPGTMVQLGAEAALYPEPVRSMLTEISVLIPRLAQSQEISDAGGRLSQEVTDTCQRAIEGRYPFNRMAEKEVTMDDFARLFGAGGVFDGFFNNTLRDKVDMSTRPWSFKSAGVGSNQRSSPGLMQFQRAAKIREAFFRGGSMPSVTLNFELVTMDQSIQRFMLDIDGQKLTFSNGPERNPQVTWPGQNFGLISIQTQPPASASARNVKFEGQWALFRMFDTLQVEPTSQPELFFVTFNIDNKLARFKVRTGSTQNPFNLPELKSFACPTNL